MLNILITGISGFVGQHLSRELVERRYAVRGLIRHPLRRPPAHFTSIDLVRYSGLDDETVIARALVGIDVVIHLAARVHAMDDTQAQDAQYQRINYLGSMTLARLAVDAGVRRFIFLSSIKVNGEERLLPYHPLDTPDPQDGYARSKYAAERGLFAYGSNQGLDVVVIRPPLIYGEGVKANFAQLIQGVTCGIPLPLGGLENQRALVSVDNLVDLLQLCISHPQAKGQLLLVSDDEAISTSELIRRIAQAYQVKPRLFYLPGVLLRGFARLVRRSKSMDRLLGSLDLDISETKQLLDWHPPRTMMQTLSAMAVNSDRDENTD